MSETSLHLYSFINACPRPHTCRPCGGGGFQGEVVQAHMSLEYDMNLECVQKEMYRKTEGI